MMTWEELTTRQDLIGGDLEVRYERPDASDFNYRGRIQNVEVTPNSVVFTFLWAARAPRRTLDWEHTNIQEFAITRDAPPTEYPENLVYTNLGGDGIVLIHPSTSRHLLQPNSVKNFPS